MSDPKPAENDLAEEFRTLGKNLADALRTAWESPERKNLQQEIESGLNELGTTLKREVDTFKDSPTGQRLKADVEEVRHKVRSGETQNEIRSELLSALRTLNNELQKVTGRMAGQEPARPAGAASAAAWEEVHEIHPDDVQTTSPESPHEEVSPDDVDAPPPPEA